jgi:peptide/nickel transport system ATP-binding protein
MTSKPLLSVTDLHTSIYTETGIVRAVDGVAFEIARGETLALLGESGCGKSFTALSVMRLLPEAAEITGGSVILDGMDLVQMPETDMRNVRGRRMAMIFQEPMLSLNPVMTVGDQIGETSSGTRIRRGPPSKHGFCNCWTPCASRTPRADATNTRFSSRAA